MKYILYGGTVQYIILYIIVVTRVVPAVPVRVQNNLLLELFSIIFQSLKFQKSLLHRAPKHVSEPSSMMMMCSVVLSDEK